MARMGPLAPAINSIRTRSTFYSSDETICLGSLIGLNLERLQSGEQKMYGKGDQKDRHSRDDKSVSDEELACRRMQIFFSMLEVFPRDIIFSSHERSNERGYLWAPEFFLGMTPRSFMRHVKGEPAILDKHRRGLAVRAAGFIIVIDKGSPMNFTSPLLINASGESGDDLKFTITIRQESGHVSKFSWEGGMTYGVIIEKSIDELS